MKVIVASGWLMASMLPGIVLAEDAGWRTVQGKDLQSLFSDHELSDGVHYTNQFRRDGSVIGVDMGERFNGTWKVKGPCLCYAWVRPAGQNECFGVKRRGNEVRMFQNGIEIFSGTVTRIRSPL
ncbi:TPA: hypothetical protein ACOEN9_001809 [Stenotrophomonas maltophilia]|jgi:hypothetical protein|uniref:hypothetical protein n=1 Tax=Lysobacteraceae TaxID=32033 RepID=UPI0003902F38|nr:MULTISPECIES: hypothetical protein [Xanthomonadaceae]EQM88079.1 hypothetical protein L681_00755 [Stenotrophomonas maltophilia MF89]MBA0336260.1 hypothetical protein [Stenotrophomonas maltophilia]MBA0539932.1 hypothetical protein [Stenotrophomonas maltophilia]MCH2091575.1 hypothetical protein [Pseudoxanthomonas sp.]MTI72845.1 hypothetical protein [Stenotrophomonas sp.]